MGRHCCKKKKKKKKKKLGVVLCVGCVSGVVCRVLVVCCVLCVVCCLLCVVCCVSRFVCRVVVGCCVHSICARLRAPAIPASVPSSEPSRPGGPEGVPHCFPTLLATVRTVNEPFLPPAACGDNRRRPSSTRAEGLGPSCVWWR